MIKLANRVKNFFHKHFVKHEVHWVPSTTIICLNSDGRKILQITKTFADGEVVQRNYEIKCLLDEGLQITAETLEMEKMLFGEPTKTEQ